MSNKLTPVLWFDKNEARNAAEFYARTFPDSHVGEAIASATDTPSGPEGQEIVVNFTVCGQPFSFMVVTENQEETDRYWNAIVGNGGEESACGWCKDKWGFSWQITPRRLLDAISSSDRAAAKRAMDAMLQMGKIDIAKIEAAYKGEAVNA
jgi:predicted 3-demethylubiquinone-9 3-methyltransferase (glyoxalase superfamily)